MTLSTNEVRIHFRAAQREGYPLNSECDACGTRGIGVFAVAYRHFRNERGLPEPGNLCATCAAVNERLIDFRHAEGDFV